MIEFPFTDWETRCLTALYQLEILDTAPEKDFDQIVALAALVSECPMATIGFVDINRTWYKAAMGLEIKTSPTANAFRFSAKQDLSAIQIEDTLWDGRLLYKTIFPLYTEEGIVLGLLTVADTKPGLLSPAKLAALEIMSLQTISLLKLRLQSIKMRHSANTKLQLAKQKSFYENILNHIPTDIAVFDADQKYLFVNPYAIKDAHFRKYIIGKDDFEYAAYRNRDNTVPLLRKEKFMKAKTTHSVVSWEDEVTDEMGKVRTNSRNFFPVYDDAGDLAFMIGYGIDISDRKKLEQEQNSLFEQLSYRNVQLMDFCNIVTHNLRGPLNNMSLLVDFVADTDDPQEQLELVSKLKPVIEGLKTTFDDLVETIQVKQNMEIKSEIVDLNDCLKKTLDGLEMEMLLAPAQIKVNFKEAPQVCFPPKYIASILYNLLSNALKYRAPERELKISIATAKKEGMVVLTVTDNGLGINMAKYHDQVFEIGKIFHSHKNAKGLGLYMTKTQVEVMGGRITVESEVDKGSTFIVVLKEQPEDCLV